SDITAPANPNSPLRRGELGFAGAVISDDILMGALSAWPLVERALLALRGGVDMLLVSEEEEGEEVLEGLMRSWEGRGLPPGRIAEAAKRVAALKGRFLDHSDFF
ncbi:MAG: hypothetical protein DRG40_08050, partial [Deltaproteobacteria bacterium]